MKSSELLKINIIRDANSVLSHLRNYRNDLMELPDDGIGRPHSHGETDNSRGLRIRAVSIAITDMESAMKRFEDATDENNYIQNNQSAWDNNWKDHFGGIDDPYDRNNFYPGKFIPKENPFYFALPYNDFNINDERECFKPKL